MENKYMNTTSGVGTPDANKKGSKSGIELLEIAFGKEFTSRMTNRLHYDDVQRFTSVGASAGSKAKAVRDENGRIDILATFNKAGVHTEDRTIAQAASIKGGWF